MTWQKVVIERIHARHQRQSQPRKNMTTVSTATIKPQRTAEIAYAEHAEAVRTKIKRLQNLLKDFDRQQKADPRNWGFAGSLEYVSDELSDIISQFSQVE